MSTYAELDLRELRQRWNAQRESLRAILSRIDTRGLRRPARDPDERAWLAARGAQEFVEDEACAVAAQEYYRRRYGG